MVLNGLEIFTEFGKSSKNFVGRERKGQAAFSPLVLLRGAEGVRKSETERPRMRTGKAVRPGSLGVEDF